MFQSDLLQRILFTLFILVCYRFGSYIPVAGVNSFALDELTRQHQGGILGMFNMLSGGSLGRMSIFALAIMPYITSSIVMQLLTMIYAPLENLKKEGEIGRKKINQYTRYLTVILASFQAFGVASGLASTSTSLGPVVVVDLFYFKVTTIVSLVVGTIFLMWLGEQISSRGIGNGTSLIIFVGIVTGIPSAVINSFELTRKGVLSTVLLMAIILGIILLISFIIYFERAQRKVPVQYPKRQVGNKVYGGDSSFIPLKLNTSGVIPPIFASSILLFPLTLLNFSSKALGQEGGVIESIAYHLNHGRPLYIVLYVTLIIFFSFFYTAIVFNSEETANNLRKYNAYVPGKRPGANTSEYFDYILSRITLVGALYLAFICVIPELLIGKYNMAFTLGGTSLLIVVNVVIDTISQVQTYLFSGQYEKLMKKMQIKSKRG